MTTTAAAGHRGRGTAPETPVLDVVVPVHNEELDLGPGVRRLHDYLSAHVPFAFRITIADNASTDATPFVAEDLVAALPGVRVVRLAEKGRGRALRTVWSGNDARVLAYLDVDMSTGLEALLPLVASVVSGHSDLAIGTRLGRAATVVRGPKREAISRCYNVLLHATLGTRFSDAQCGFKAIRADVAQRLLPLVQDQAWFFDTELLVLAERAGLRIHEVPVDWVDDPDSRVDIVPTALEDLRGVARLARGLVSGALTDELRGVSQRPPRPTGAGRQLARFAAVGVLSTLGYLLLYLLLRSALGALSANAVALLVTAVLNTAVNRRWTFGVVGRDRLARHHFEGLGVFALGLALTSGALGLLHLVDRRPTRVTEVAALFIANAAATALRFVLLRGWVFHPRRRVLATVEARVPAAAPPGERATYRYSATGQLLAPEHRRP